ncbi:MAG: CPBP family intramembrane metalloprotease [Spirochaetaceae bacterium]|nr:CPBP family intramembrane metalloprotease [Spirochaetaceae bacterium]
MYKFLSGLFGHPLFVPLAIYTLFFFPDSYSVQTLFTPASESTLPFSAFDELFQIFVFYIPALALVLYFLFQYTRNLPLKKRYSYGSAGALKLYINYTACIILCTICLLLIGGFTIMAETVLTRAEDFPTAFAPVVEVPDGVFAVFVMVLSCIVAAYLEESFFRALLYNRLLVMGLQKVTAILTASLLFACCHAWQGFWGMSGAFLSGVFLGFLFDRQKSLNIIALGHALYNIIVYLLPF